MNKFRVFFLVAATVVAGLMTSCSKDDTNPVPSIFFEGTAISNNQVTCGESTYSLKANLRASGKFQTVTMTVANGSNFGSTQTQTLTGYSKNDTVYSVNSSIPITSDTKVTISVTDKDNQTASETLTILLPEISSYTAVLMGGASNSSYGSFFDASTGSVLTSSAANADPSKVDLIFTYSAQGSANLFAGPSDSQIASAFTAVNITSWTILNNTLFTTVSGTGLTSTTFSSLTYPVLSTAVATTNATSTRVTNLAVGDIFGFITAANKKGVAQVKNIGGTDASSRSITVDVKVAK